MMITNCKLDLLTNENMRGGIAFPFPRILESSCTLKISIAFNCTVTPMKISSIGNIIYGYVAYYEIVMFQSMFP